MNWITIVPTLLGGFLTLLGGVFQSWYSENKHRKAEIRKMKLDILINLKAYRVVLFDVGTRQQSTSEERAQIIEARPPFVKALNQISIVFIGNKTVIKNHKKFCEEITSENSNSDTYMMFLYELIKSMHEDLDIEIPNKDIFMNTLF